MHFHKIVVWGLRFYDCRQQLGVLRFGQKEFQPDFINTVQQGLISFEIACSPSSLCLFKKLIQSCIKSINNLHRRRELKLSGFFNVTVISPQIEVKIPRREFCSFCEFLIICNHKTCTCHALNTLV